MKNKNRFNVILNHSVNMIYPLSIYLIINISLGLEVFGKYSIYIAVQALTKVYFDFGFPQLNIIHFKNKSVNEILSEGFNVRFFLLIFILPFYIYLIYIDHVYLFILVISLLMALIPEWYYISKDTLGRFTLFNLTLKLISVILILILVYSNAVNLDIIFFIYLIQMLMLNIISYIEIKELPILLKLKLVQMVFKNNFKFFFNSLLINFNRNIVYILGQSFLTLDTIGVYSIIDKVYLAFQNINAPLSKIFIRDSIQSVEYKLVYFLIFSLFYYMIPVLILVYYFELTKNFNWIIIGFYIYVQFSSATVFFYSKYIIPQEKYNLITKFMLISSFCNLFIILTGFYYDFSFEYYAPGALIISEILIMWSSLYYAKR